MDFGALHSFADSQQLFQHLTMVNIARLSMVMDTPALPLRELEYVRVEHLDEDLVSVQWKELRSDEMEMEVREMAMAFHEGPTIVENLVLELPEALMLQLEGIVATERLTCSMCDINVLQFLHPAVTEFHVMPTEVKPIPVTFASVLERLEIVRKLRLPIALFPDCDSWASTLIAWAKGLKKLELTHLTLTFAGPENLQSLWQDWNAIFALGIENFYFVFSALDRSEASVIFERLRVELDLQGQDSVGNWYFSSRDSRYRRVCVCVRYHFIPYVTAANPRVLCFNH